MKYLKENVTIKKAQYMNLGIESETIEFKKSTAELEKAVDNIASMLNKHGHGTVYFGVARTAT